MTRIIVLTLMLISATSFAIEVPLWLQTRPVVAPTGTNDYILTVVSSAGGKLVKRSTLASTGLAPKASPVFTGTVTFPNASTTTADGSRGIKAANANKTTCPAADANTCWWNVSDQKWKCCNAALSIITVGP